MKNQCYVRLQVSELLAQAQCMLGNVSFQACTGSKRSYFVLRNEMKHQRTMATALSIAWARPEASSRVKKYYCRLFRVLLLQRLNQNKKWRMPCKTQPKAPKFLVYVRRSRIRFASIFILVLLLLIGHISERCDK